MKLVLSDLVLAMVATWPVVGSYGFQILPASNRQNKNTHLFESKHTDILSRIEILKLRNKVNHCIHNDYSVGMEDKCSVDEMEILMRHLNEQQELLVNGMKKIDSLPQRLAMKAQDYEMSAYFAGC